MKIQIIKYIVLLVVGLFSYSIAHANTTQQVNSTTQYSATEVNKQQELTLKAQQWGLKADEYQRYQELMDGPLGIYSPGLDPLTALGISARTEEERRYFAELQVVAETQRVERELAYQKAYDEAFKRLLPDLLPVDFGLSAKASPASVTLSSNGRLAVFVRDSCAPCDAKVKQLHKAGTAFDVYFVGSKTDATIRKWATKVGIDPQKVVSKTITLNHDNGRWQTMGLNGELPAVVKEVNGKWQRQ